MGSAAKPPELPRAKLFCRNSATIVRVVLWQRLLTKALTSSSLTLWLVCSPVPSLRHPRDPKKEGYTNVRCWRRNVRAGTARFRQLSGAFRNTNARREPFSS
jgi:hypothetical protein